MNEIKTNNKQVQYLDRLYIHYREYIEFLNDLIITKPLTLVLLAIPNLIMIMDLSLHVGSSQNYEAHLKDTQEIRFLQNISYLGVSEAILQIIQLSVVARYLILVIILALLLSPLITIAQICLITWFQPSKSRQIGEYRRIYESSVLHSLIRIFISQFQYTFMPIFTSVGIKLSSLANRGQIQNEVFLGTLILILTPVVYLLGEYHLLQIMDQKDVSAKTHPLLLVRVNFPNNIFDCGLIYLYIILINQTQSSLPFIVAMIIYTLRFLIVYYLPYYQPIIRKQQIYMVISSLIAVVGLLIAHISKQIYIVMLIIVAILTLFGYMKEEIAFNQVEGGEEYQKVQGQEKTVEALKRQLWKNGTFSYVFRELILLSRQNNTQRKQLLIEILKTKCYEMESKSRGGSKIANTEDLIKYQGFFVNFLGNMLLIGDHSISILKLLQSKEPKRQIFAHQIKHLVNLINQNKQIITGMREINDISSQGVILMKVMFNDFYNDSEFVRELEQKSRLHITSLVQKQTKMRLFNKKTTAIFINVLDQTGKITKVSKNIPAILGHSPNDLVGKSINQIIPFTIQPFHDATLIKFVEKFSKKTIRNDPKIQFYAYTKDFNLQECLIRYNFVMSYFSSFQLSGVVRKIQEDKKNVILMNRYGFLEGWTAELSQLFNFEEFQMGQCLKFNYMPLFPALLKFFDADYPVCAKTIVFRCGKVKQKLLLASQFRNLSGQQLTNKLFQTFKQLLQNDEMIQAYLADVDFENLIFCEGKAIIKQIIIRSYERIENFNQIQDIIIKTLNGQKIQENQDEEVQDKTMTKDISMSEYSMLGEETTQSKFIDTNFTIDMSSPNILKIQEIRLQSEVSKSQLSIELNDPNPMEEENLLNEEINANTSQQQANDALIQNSFSPKLQSHHNFLPILIILAIGFIGIIIWDQVVLSQTQDLMSKECKNAINRNRALMIYAKSSFNPNATYIRQFDNGRLMEVSSFLGSQTFQYKTYLGDEIIQNRFYMFNVQIPSTLDRILLAPNQSKRSQYQKQIQYNFENIIKAWQERFNDSLNFWSGTISQVRFDFSMRLVFLCLGSVAFSFFLIYIYLQYRKQRKMTQAFFKFQKVDLQDKIQSIRKVIKIIELKAIDWHLDKEFYNHVKKNQITNLEFELEGAPCETKIKFQTSQEVEEKFAKKKFQNILLFVVVFLLTQLLFIVLYSVLNLRQINTIQAIPEDLNQACKLTVLPNLMLANMFYEVPTNMLTQYKKIQTQILERPNQSVPNLFSLLEEPPCIDCKFLYPLLTTNFRSFYSTFEQIIDEKTANNDKNISQLYYAVDVVVERVSGALQTRSLMYLPYTIFLYIFSLVVFFVSIYLNIRKIIDQNERLEVFLKYFDEEILIKNKHMNGLFNKNT